jgi:hypothetical protein
MMYIPDSLASLSHFGYKLQSSYTSGFVLTASSSSMSQFCLGLTVIQLRLSVLVQDKVNVVHGSWFLSLEDQKGSLAGVISNPPYIPSANIAALQAEVGKHEPRTALDGGQDGMKDLRQICHGSALALRAGGFLALEVFFSLDIPSSVQWDVPQYIHSAAMLNLKLVQVISEQKDSLCI